MPTSRLTVAGDIAGISMNSTASRSHDSQAGGSYDLPAAIAGVLTTRVGDNEGTLTLADGHGLTTGAKVRLFWPGGQCDATLTVAGNAASFTGADNFSGGASVLPAKDTALTVCAKVTIALTVNGADLACAGLLCNDAGHASIRWDGGTLEVDLAAGELWHWLSGTGTENPLAAADPIEDVVATHASAAAARLNIGFGYDGTP